jgi:hypothetical protein
MHASVDHVRIPKDSDACVKTGGERTREREGEREREREREKRGAVSVDTRSDLSCGGRHSKPSCYPSP